MKWDQGEFRLSATDVANHLSCNHLTQLERQAARGEITPPAVIEDPQLEALRQRGRDHESAYVNHLEEQGYHVVRVEPEGGTRSTDRAAELMASGADVILQASIGHGRWHGIPDLLFRVERPSDLGSWSYEPADMKLARKTKGEAVLQLCLYAELLEGLQGLLPEAFHVITPERDWEAERYRTSEYIAYHRLVKRALEHSVAEPARTYPEPVPRCDTCRWHACCESRWRSDDHLSLVAGISRTHRKELVQQSVNTLAELAALPLPLPFRPERGAAETYERLREQARVQDQQRKVGELVYELLPVEEGRGLARLPEPDAGDVFFDIEGDPFAGRDGLEYLFGWVAKDEDGIWRYRGEWATNPVEERQTFECFIDAMLEHWQRYPNFHIYHFGAYEPGALKRLMGRHATREEALDDLLRGERFVDLHTALRQGVRAGVERYSLKDLEDYHRFERRVDLREANQARVTAEVALELGQLGDITEAQWAMIADYNADDCHSTRSLRDWLEALRDQWEAAGFEVPRPNPVKPKESEEPDEGRERVLALMADLAGDVPDDPTQRTEEEHARWLLAQLLDWERREEKVVWWDLFRLADLETPELFDERRAIAYLTFDGGAGGTAKAPVHRYRFPSQEVAIERSDELRLDANRTLGKVEAIDRAARTVDVKKRMDAAQEHPEAVFAFKRIQTQVLSDAVCALGESVRDGGIDAEGPGRAERDLLLRRPPRRRADAQQRPLRTSGETPQEAAARLVTELDGGVLPIQGPPGTGKTTTGARMIIEAVRAGLKVGVTANSHKVISNLVDSGIEMARQEGLDISFIQKVHHIQDDRPEELSQVTQNGQIRNAFSEGRAQVGAGTPWLWARSDMEDSIDVLFIDEAGQLALARALAVARSARSLVLLGDPAQLEQPIQGSHPEGADASAMEHLLGDDQTFPEDRGLFLDTSFRLHPQICHFVSDLFYAGRLKPHSGLERQRIVGETPFAGAGLWFVPVEHQGNQVSSSEEVERVVEIISQLTSGDIECEDTFGARHALTIEDVLIVAPYNSQVAAISARLPGGARVGTVDKFQGQEAPVVIYSMATSTPEEAPRGMEFLYSANRMNVATSRAKMAVILISSPELLIPECRTPRQIQLGNILCRYVDLAKG